MSRIIKLLNNETIEIVEYSKANACFQTNKYPNDELFCVIREQINPFDMFQKKLSLEQEIDRLNNIINQADNKNLELIQKINKIYDVIENRNITGIEARLLIQDILDKEEIMYNKKKLNQLCNKEINIIFSEKGYGKRFHESQQFKKLKYYKKQYKNIIDRINNDLEEFNDKLNTFKWLENDFKEHSIHYYQLECLVDYLKQLKEYE